LFPFDAQNSDLFAVAAMVGLPMFEGCTMGMSQVFVSV
jgi:hypothetical protein